MIDAEKLLGKVLSGAMNSGGRKKKKKRKNDDMMSSLLGGLTSGKGLVTAIGLGIGAYEILKAQKTAAQPISSPPAGGGTVPPTPPPIPGSAAPPVPPVQTPPAVQEPDALAARFLQIMIAAAHADGQLDQAEEERILEMLQEQGLSGEERRYLAAQLHAPKPIEELVSGIERNPSVAQTMYSMALTAIDIDTEAERQWLDKLAGALSLSPAMQRFLEEDL